MKLASPDERHYKSKYASIDRNHLTKRKCYELKLFGQVQTCFRDDAGTFLEEIYSHIGKELSSFGDVCSEIKPRKGT